MKKLYAALGSALMVGACSSYLYKDGNGPSNMREAWDDTSTFARTPASAAVPLLDNLPWELHGSFGETLVPDVYYAENSENEQMMPVAVHGRHQIDRLIYPTLGNPALVARSESARKWFAVLRVESEVVSQLGALSDRSSNPNYVQSLIPGDGRGARLRVHLVSRAARVQEEPAQVLGAGGAGIYEVTPEQIEVDRLSANMPPEFQKRRTLRLTFSAASVAQVPDGLYDIRFEVDSGGGFARSQAGDSMTEFQYNAVSILSTFDPGRYSIVNVTDTQVALYKDANFRHNTLDRLNDFKNYVNRAMLDPASPVSKAHFITFNGDLHNGGTPASISIQRVADNYRAEAEAILDVLKDLNMPIHLTVGNHDGYVAMGPVAKGVLDATRAQADVDLRTICAWKKGVPVDVSGIAAQARAKMPVTSPEWTPELYANFVKEIDAQPGGKNANIFVGQYMHFTPTQGNGANPLDDAWRVGWVRLPEAHRNFVLYDGFNQWRKTYGPLHSAWVFGQNQYVSLNSFELRQHRRAGWGMYTVNYGGGLSPTQTMWLDRELTRAQKNNLDIIVLAHHDPRGGHNGKDHPYYFQQIDYDGMKKSLFNYVNGEIVLKKICQEIPSKIINASLVSAEILNTDCTHDGLQEWMKADPQFDCGPDARMANSDQAECDLKKYSDKVKPWASGYAFLHRLAGESHDGTALTNFRTALFGHTHFHSLDILQSGDALVPDHLTIDAQSIQHLEALERVNPVRNFDFVTQLKDHLALLLAIKNNYLQDLNKGDYKFQFQRILQPNGPLARDFAIIRMTSNANLTSQRWLGNAMYGFTVMDIFAKPDSRQYALPQINRLVFFLNDGTGNFVQVPDTVALDRSKSLRADEAGNPILDIFQMAD